MNRREVLASMCAAAVGVVGWPNSALARLLRREAAANQSAAVQSHGVENSVVDDRLRRDLAQLGIRADSEEGVPVILACENLVVAKGQKAAPLRLTAFNTAFVSEFRRNAEAWERLQPNSPNTDVAKLIQILAKRDFAQGGLERQF